MCGSRTVVRPQCNLRACDCGTKRAFKAVPCAIAVVFAEHGSTFTAQIPIEVGKVRPKDRCPARGTRGNGKGSPGQWKTTPAAQMGTPQNAMEARKIPSENVPRLTTSAKSHATSGECRVTFGERQTTSGQCRVTFGKKLTTSGRCRVAFGKCRATFGERLTTSGQCRETFGRCHTTSRQCC